MRYMHKKKVPPVCPLTPRAAPVAVKRTIASRSSWIFSAKVAFSAPLSVGLEGSSLSLMRRDGEQPAHTIYEINGQTFCIS